MEIAPVFSFATLKLVPHQGIPTDNTDTKPNSDAP